MEIYCTHARRIKIRIRYGSLLVLVIDDDKKNVRAASVEDSGREFKTFRGLIADDLEPSQFKGQKGRSIHLFLGNNSLTSLSCRRNKDGTYSGTFALRNGGQIFRLHGAYSGNSHTADSPELHNHYLRFWGIWPLNRPAKSFSRWHTAL